MSFLQEVVDDDEDGGDGRSQSRTPIRPLKHDGTRDRKQTDKGNRCGSMNDEQERRKTEERREHRDDQSVSRSIISEAQRSSHSVVAADAETRARHERENLPLPDKEARAHLPLCTATATHPACIAGGSCHQRERRWASSCCGRRQTRPNERPGICVFAGCSSLGAAKRETRAVIGCRAPICTPKEGLAAALQGMEVAGEEITGSWQLLPGTCRRCSIPD